MIGERKRDGARAAVEIEHRLLPRKVCKFDSLCVQPLRLRAVDLIKRRHAQEEALAAERILEPVFSPERSVTVAEDDVALFRVCAQHDAGALGAGAAQKRNERFLLRQLVPVHEHADKALPRRV